MAKVHIKIKTDKRNCRKLINHCLLFLFRWKYMREKPFLCRVYICKSAKQESRGGEHSPPLILYIEKVEGKGGCLRGKGSYL